MNWDDLKIFLAVAEATSMRVAARNLRISHSTVSRRLDGLETALGARVLDRRTGGFQLTEAGEELLTVALRMDESLHEFARGVAGRDSLLVGQVRVTIPDAAVIGLFMPLFREFMEENPGIQIKINDSDDVFDLSRREADIAIRFTNAPAEHLIGRRLGTSHQAAYATPAYVREHRPEAEDSTAKWIGWGAPEKRPSWIEHSPFPHLGVAGHFDNALIQHQAARQGVGIGFFPCILGDPDPDLIRLGAPIPSLDAWLLSHRDLRAAARMRVFRQFIIRQIPHISAALEGRMVETRPAVNS